ncbi:hypothetical protein PSTG_14549 [Puccinia striiformis f. sp. tritici PST-78]|uniref:Uncharacterized protein n=1 Tax=Puccinia striiformis f. sp. tritici PST-78 TaxID=1165861 RepID=A0A0L0UZA7_9BASI|nr:hypothetical protein PSTG_14549 [Puccinia striiformis f. sp. tritici PST-78]
MNSRVAMISKALILVFSASLASDVYATTFKCDAGQTETCQYGSSECIATTHPHNSDNHPPETTRLSVSATIPSIAVATANPRVALLSRATTNAMHAAQSH